MVSRDIRIVVCDARSTSDGGTVDVDDASTSQSVVVSNVGAVDPKLPLTNICAATPAVAVASEGKPSYTDGGVGPFANALAMDSKVDHVTDE